MRNWINLVEGAAKTAIFYHGTSSKKLGEIKLNGLSPNPSERVWLDQKSALGGVYMTVGEDWARKYAQDACKHFGGQPVVLRIEARWSDLRMDEDEIVMFIEDCLVDEDSAKGAVKVFLRASGAPKAAKADAVSIAELLIANTSRSDSAFLEPLQRLVAICPAQETLIEDNPNYQVHYPGPIGFEGSPRIVQ